jgi:photosystem II stability/assembly factor-like uncharacterized protein
MMKKQLFLTLIFLFLTISLVTAKSNFYVSVLIRENYIVGAKNLPTGLYLWQGDTTWKHIGWKNLPIWSLDAAPENPDYMFVAAGNGALRTLDGGQSWKITTDWRVTEVSDVSIHPLDHHLVYIATSYGIWKTTDGGESWIESNNGLNPTFTQTIQCDASSLQRVVAGGEEGLFLSTNQGESWKPTGPLPVPVKDIISIRQTPRLWLAGTEKHGVLISKNQGKTWVAAEGNIQDQTIYKVNIHPNNPKLMAAGGYQTGVFISSDGGQTWKQNKKGLKILDIHGLAFDPNEKQRLWIGTMGDGVYFSEDFGESWNYAGLSGALVSDMKFITR